MSRIWNRFDAELADTRQAVYPPKRPCLYCGHPTRALTQVCPAHDDLPALDEAQELSPRSAETAATDGTAAIASWNRPLCLVERGPHLLEPRFVDATGPRSVGGNGESLPVAGLVQAVALT